MFISDYFVIYVTDSAIRIVFIPIVNTCLWECSWFCIEYKASKSSFGSYSHFIIYFKNIFLFWFVPK